MIFSFPVVIPSLLDHRFAPHPKATGHHESPWTVFRPHQYRHNNKPCSSLTYSPESPKPSSLWIAYPMGCLSFPFFGTKKIGYRPKKWTSGIFFFPWVKIFTSWNFPVWFHQTASPISTVKNQTHFHPNMGHHFPTSMGLFLSLLLCRYSGFATLIRMAIKFKKSRGATTQIRYFFYISYYFLLGGFVTAWFSRLAQIHFPTSMGLTSLQVWDWLPYKYGTPFPYKYGTAILYISLQSYLFVWK